MTDTITHTFSELGLPEFILTTLEDIGYTKPSPIQSACIPHLLAGHDVLGMAQTGSGKTAAFALPFLSQINVSVAAPQLLVLAPTRELAVQVSEAFEAYSKKINGLKVLALYGGQRYDLQLRALRQGPQIIVGTPGRLLDHLRRKTLEFTHLKGLVLDEADEMLRMGFIDDVETIMAALPKGHQTALFSATMPDQIRRIARRFMNNPEEIRIDAQVKSAPEIKQNFWYVQGIKKDEALVRFLEVESFEATIIFVRTKTATLEVTETLERYGYNCAALNGDMNQSLREQTLERLRDGRLDILIATDVAARGLDVERISLVINYDIPLDVESYIHRIGRTGRAGRAGRALLFVGSREIRLLKNIERVLRLTIAEVELPNNSEITASRLEKLFLRIEAEKKSNDLDVHETIFKSLQSRLEGEFSEKASAILLKLLQRDRPLVLPEELPAERRAARKERSTEFVVRRDSSQFSADRPRRARRETGGSAGMDLYRIEVGRDDGIEIRHIVGAIANEGDLSSKDIGNIRLFPSHAFLELPKGLSNDVMTQFSRTRILNKPIKMQRVPSNSGEPFTGRSRSGQKDASEFRKPVRGVSGQSDGVVGARLRHQIA